MILGGRNISPGQFLNVTISDVKRTLSLHRAKTSRKAEQYLEFWRELQKRPTVQGVTYFVASASNPAFSEEVWVGRGIGQRIGGR